MRVFALTTWAPVLPAATLLLSQLSHASPVAPDSIQSRQDHLGHQHDHDMDHDAADVADDVMHTSAPFPEVSSTISDPKPSPPDPHGGHSHGSHAAPMVILNDTDIHRWHSYPISYLAADFRLTEDQAIFGEEFDAEYDPQNASSHLGLATLHVAGFYSAYFGLLPLSLALRAGEHPSHYLVNGAFLILAVLGWLAGAAYNVSTPDRYEGSAYPKFVNILVFTSLVLATIDSMGLIKRAINYWRSGEKISWKGLKSEMFRTVESHSSNRYEMVGLVESPGRVSEEEPAEHHVVFALGDDEDDEEQAARPARSQRPSLGREWSNPSRQSTGSDGTLHENESPRLSSLFGAGVRKHHPREGVYDAGEAGGSGIRLLDDTTLSTSKLSRRISTTLTVIRRFQVVFAYVTMIVGISTYTGMCRGTFLASCAAHNIKGSIFLWYGLLTFGRYLGAYADLGWAWNRQPGSAKGPSAEMVECSVIFLYGISNTWLERLGSHAGDPYTVKQVQHISIAVMFWFAGLSGILLESKTIRRVLASAKGGQEVTEPPSYAFSFNPLPALVIAVTGLAMAAHHQTYLFQVEIHALWGILLAGGSVARWLTYFFLWLRPPIESTLPSRPPTEIITSFGWAAGGIVFMLSNEEIAFAAMRASYDDKMAFLNFTIALTALIFC